MTPGPTPPVVLVAGRVYSINIPLTYGGVTVARPCFQVLDISDGVIEFSLVGAVVSTEVYSVWGLRPTDYDPELFLEVPAADFTQLIVPWFERCVSALSVWYSGLSSQGFDTLDAGFGTDFDFTV